MNKTCPVGLAKMVTHSDPVSQRLFSFQMKTYGGCGSISFDEPHQIFNKKSNLFH
jgi:hypothetical protein